MKLITIDGKALLRAIAPTVRGYKGARQGQIIDAFGGMLPEVLDLADAETPLRIAHFLAQVGHESDGYSALEEYDSGAAYEGRVKTLGNTQPGDGKRFKGRSLIMNTGRRNYAEFGQWIRRWRSDAPDFETRPDLMAQFPWAGYAAAWYWLVHNLNAYADADDLVGATREINGGKNGLADRRAYLSRAKKAVAKAFAADLPTAPALPTLQRGAEGDAVETLQRALNVANSRTLMLGVDGDFGAATELVVKHFQTMRGLKVDGIVAAKTWAALKPYIRES
jgi:putative chitinase